MLFISIICFALGLGIGYMYGMGQLHEEYEEEIERLKKL